MEENISIGLRTTTTVHELDRTSSELLAKAYQHLMARQQETSASNSSVHHGVKMIADSRSMQEA